MKDFAYWLYNVMGKQRPKEEVVNFYCDRCHKQKPVEELNAEQDRRGYIQKLCDNCFLK